MIPQKNAIEIIKENELKNLVGGVFEEMPGNDAPLKITKSFKGDHIIDNAFKNLFSRYFYIVSN